MSIDAYFIQEENSKRLEMLIQLRDMVRAVLGDYEETLDYKMPTYYVDGQCICAFASQKSHMSLYIMPYDLLAQFKDRLKKYNMGKSCIRFKKMTEEDLQLFTEILVYCKDNYSSSQFNCNKNLKK